VRADHSQLETAALGAAPGQAVAPGQGQKALNRCTRARGTSEAISSAWWLRSMTSWWRKSVPSLCSSRDRPRSESDHIAILSFCWRPYVTYTENNSARSVRSHAATSAAAWTVSRRETDVASLVERHGSCS
jgi:hypothetical protein